MCSSGRGRGSAESWYGTVRHGTIFWTERSRPWPGRVVVVRTCAVR